MLFIPNKIPEKQPKYWKCLQGEGSNVCWGFFDSNTERFPVGNKGGEASAIVLSGVPRVNIPQKNWGRDSVLSWTGFWKFKSWHESPFPSSVQSAATFTIAVYQLVSGWAMKLGGSPEPMVGASREVFENKLKQMLCFHRSLFLTSWSGGTEKIFCSSSEKSLPF